MEPIIKEAVNANQIDIDKEVQPYGPWLLVSYEKQGNRNFKGKLGKVEVAMLEVMPTMALVIIGMVVLAILNLVLMGSIILVVIEIVMVGVELLEMLIHMVVLGMARLRLIGR